jgi:hypothetical protein
LLQKCQSKFSSIMMVSHSNMFSFFSEWTTANNYIHPK